MPSDYCPIFQVNPPCLGKPFVLLMLLFLIAADLIAQPVPGTYTSKIGMQLHRIRISADSTYERSSYIELAHGVHQSRGFWFLHGDTVILKQAPWGAEYSSHNPRSTGWKSHLRSSGMPAHDPYAARHQNARTPALLPGSIALILLR